MMQNFNAKLKFILLCTCVLLLLLDFIPIKFAVPEILTTTNEYIYSYELKTGLPDFTWITYKEASNNRCLLKAYIIGEQPYDMLSTTQFNPYKLFNGPKQNSFKFYGNTEMTNTKDDNQYDVILHLDKWDIVQPINRTSIRKYYVSKNYLTIYDFDWIKVLKNCFN